MPIKDEEEQNYWKAYREKNKEKTKAYNKAYREKNKEKIKLWKKENKEKLLEYKKQYSQTDKGIKGRRITSWKTYKVKCDDWDKLYDYFVSVKYCEECNCLLDDCSKSRKCLDHDHDTGLFRNVLCNSCNVKRG